MKSGPSLRRRILFGAIFWSIGLFAVSGAFVVGLIEHHSGTAEAFHRAFTHVPAVLLVTVLALAAGLWYVRRGLSPVAQLRERLAAVHAGRERSIAGTYPAEIQPLVDDLNALLTHQQQTVQRAVAKAGDLAHGLKTPLALLANEAEQARRTGQADLAAAISQQVDRMRRQIDHHLAHARAAASGATPGVSVPVAECAEGLARTVRQLYAEKHLDIQLDVAPAHAVRVRREDADEMLGNLLDNACKWTRARVRLTSSSDAAHVVIDVDDDGSGLPASMRDAVLQRGVRADERAPGSGFGLAIVRDLAHVYGGSVTLDESPLGGLRARLRLPKAG